MTDKQNPVYVVIAEGLTLPIATASNIAGGWSPSVDDPYRSGYRSEVAPIGYELEITPELIEHERNRLGVSWVEHLTDADQVGRWGKIFLQEGRLSDHPAVAEKIEAERAAAEEAELQQYILAAARQKGGLSRLRAAAVAAEVRQ
jgi:hypothetical protein